MGVGKIEFFLGRLLLGGGIYIPTLFGVHTGKGLGITDFKVHWITWVSWNSPLVIHFTLENCTQFLSVFHCFVVVCLFV